MRIIRRGLAVGDRSLAAVAAAVAIAGAALVVVATRRWGLGVSYDSVVYVQASHHLSAVPLPQPDDRGGKALYWWAPLYPLALRPFGGSYDAARFLAAALLAAGASVVGLTAWRMSGPRAAVVAAALYAFSPAVVAVHLNLLAEPLFLTLEAAALLLVAERRSASAGVAAGLATVTRYAGLPLLVAGAIALRGRDRIRFLVPALLVYGCWLIRNEIVAGETTGRSAVWHPPAVSVVGDGARALIDLLVTPGNLPSLHFATAGVIVQIAAGAAIFIGLYRRRFDRVPRTVLVCSLFSVVYVAFVIVTRCWFDALTPFDERIFIPLAPAFVLSLTWILRDTLAPAAVLVAAFVIGSLQVAHTFSGIGMDYSGQVWSRGAMSAKSLPQGPLYSNWAAAVAYFTGRSPRRLPNPIDEHTTLENPNFQREIDALVRKVRNGRASIVLLDETFLQIPTGGPPSKSFPELASLCHRVAPYVYVCSART
jgi:Dolichyl-phosphate-mannose-protein mannosyltransferase